MGATELVLLVCVENSDRSQMAEAFEWIHAGDGIETASSGFHPSGWVGEPASG